MLQSITQANKG